MVRKRELYSSAIRSRLMIRDALLELMSEKNFESISVSEIMKRADLVRRTFYAHYKTKEDIITQYIDSLINDSLDHVLNGVIKCNGSMALVYFRLWNDHKDFITLLKDNNQLVLLNNFHKYINYVHEQSNVFINMGLSSGASKYAAKFYAGAMWSVLSQWIETGMEETPEELSDLLYELFGVSQEYGCNNS